MKTYRRNPKHTQARSDVRKENADKKAAEKAKEE
tara:strand:+ start:87 stop:188 length:102 start_codon:yes stop_codon:yes gene_type:complete